jgi:polyketide biosynthesis enoyl-CoA hydratase PksI
MFAPDLVVNVEDVSRGVVRIRMRDLDGKNALSDRLVGQLMAAFADVACRDDVKVVVLTGDGPYFCTGGTRETLLAIHEKQFSFSETNLYRVSIDCPVPVVSAMQGHAMGGGLVLGLGADICILAAERIYAANFMNYGFTPGMGATCILPYRLGDSLAGEMLLSGVGYRGIALRERGMSLRVLPADEVLESAENIAKEMAKSPRVALQALKRHMLQPLLERLPQTIKAELAMHKLTFHHPDVRDRIVQNYGV